MKKKLFFAVAGLLIACSATYAQKAYEAGSNLINVGINLGDSYYGYSSGIGLSASYERGVTENISVGGTLGYTGSSYSGPGYSVKYSAVLIAGKGSYHFLTTDKLDPYAGLDLGYVTLSHSYSGNIDPYYSYTDGGLKLWIHGGTRYYFNPGVGIFGELQIGSSAILALGACFKF